MATKKTTKTSGAPKIKESAREIWLAGLGAFSVAGEEGGKVFKQLVKKGAAVEKEKKVQLADLGEQWGESANKFKENAKGAMKNLSAPIESGITSAMQRLGVPTRAEIVNLTKRVEELTKAVARAKGEARPASKAKSASSKA